MTTAVLNGEAPPEWRRLRVKDITTYVNRGVAPSYSEAPTEVLVFNQKCLRPDRSIDLSLGKYQDVSAGPQWRRGRLQPGDVLVNSTGTGTLGRAGLFLGADVDVMADGHVTILRPDVRQVDSRFLAYLLGIQAFYAYANDALAVGATNQTELNRDRLRALGLRLPDRDEQRRIADFLDRKLAQLDALAAEERRQADLIAEHRRSLVEQYVWPEGSTTRPLRSVVQEDRPCTYGIVLPGPHVEGGVPILKAGNVTTGVLPPVAALKCTTANIEFPYRRARVMRGDLVMAIRGSIGAVAIVPNTYPTPVNLTQDTARIAPDGRVVDPGWLLHVLRSMRVQAAIDAVSTGATIRGLNIWSLKRLSIPDLPIERQRHAVDELEVKLAPLDELQSELDVQMKLLAEHRVALITAAVTGQLNFGEGV